MKKDVSKPGQEKKVSDKGLKIKVPIEKHEKNKKTESNKPKEKNKQARSKQVKIDVVQKIIELHNNGVPASKIGLILRNDFNIYSVKKYSRKTITQILRENNLEPELPEDLSNLLRKAVKLLKHMKENKKDMTSKLGYQKTVSKIRRLAKYYKRVGKLPIGWKYSDKQAAILVK